NIRHVPTGAIEGQVSLEGKPYTQHLPIWLDGGRAVKTDSHGRFKLAHVLPGTHTVQIAPTSLSADLCPDKFDADVDVKAGKTNNVDFAIHHVAQIHGSIKVLPDALGKVDPTAGIGVTISAGGGFATTTDQNDEFVLGDIPAGTYAITLNKGTIPPDFEVVGPDSVTVNVVPDQPTEDVQFTIQPIHMNIQFADSGSAAPSRPSTAIKVTPVSSPSHASASPASTTAKHENSVTPIRIAKRPIKPVVSVQAVIRSRRANPVLKVAVLNQPNGHRRSPRAHLGVRRRCLGCMAFCDGCRHCRCACCGCSHGRCSCRRRMRHTHRHVVRPRKHARSAVHRLPAKGHVTLATRHIHRHHIRHCRCYCRPRAHVSSRRIRR
ncbi:MAG TPA: hypothetical protein VFW40_01885, partial [Capsulimonadaceae bacterium]|nr:hypothetical protein [Capsulimonadaceae bacterium]